MRIPRWAVLGLLWFFACASNSRSQTERGLSFLVGNSGLDSLSFNGESLLRSPQSGNLQLSKSLFRAAIDAVLNNTSSPVVARTQTDTIALAYPWGRVSCVYRKRGDNGIAMQIAITNTSAEAVNDLSLRLV